MRHKRLADSALETADNIRGVTAEHLSSLAILADSKTQHVAERLRTVEPVEQDARVEALIRLRLSGHENLGRKASEWIVRLLDAEPPIMDTDFTHLPAFIHADDTDRLLERYSDSPRVQDLIIILDSMNAPLGENGFRILVGNLYFRRVSRILARRNPEMFGCLVDDLAWSWHLGLDEEDAQAASDALCVATRGQPFDTVAARLAPWRLLAAARMRGARTDEIRYASSMLSSHLAANNAVPTFSMAVALRLSEDADGPVRWKPWARATRRTSWSK